MSYKGPPIPTIRRFGLDVEEQTAVFELADGAEFEVPFPRSLSPGEAGIRRAQYDVTSGEFVATLPMGDEITLEMDKPGTQSRQPSRPVVYLDQLHWVTLAQRRWAPEKLSKANHHAAGELTEMAEAREITIAISSANLTETTQTDGRHRRHMATTILGLSRGWQMRNPIAIRGREFRAVLKGEDPRINDPFSLEPGSVFADGLRPIDAPEDFPPDWQQWFQRITAVNAMVAAAIDDEKISKAEGNAMADQWARSHHELALYMRENRTPKEHVRANALARLISDMSEEITGAATDAELDQEQLTAWLENRLEGDLAHMPYMGRHFEVIHQRLSNSDDRWEANDLTDINYLACAAGYADVVGEKKISEYLKRSAPRVSGGAFICRKLADAVEYLRS